MRAYFKLTKFGIGLFVMITGLAGYAVSFPVGQPIDVIEPLLLLIGLYLISAGSFALNQVQEWRLDRLMDRTASRPVASGQMAAWQAAALGIVFCVFGALALYLLSPVSAALGILTLVLYNGLYTLFWKRRWAFGAVPGAIPGAMPVVIGYAVYGRTIFTPECFYLFLIMFLWQMPHFWSLAIRYKDDYEKGGFPVLPVSIGERRTLYHVGLYTFTYVGVAMAAPAFFNTHILYLLLVMPLAVKVLYEFFKYFKSENKKSWLPFFLWVNVSMLVFISVPVFDRWLFYLLAVM